MAKHSSRSRNFLANRRLRQNVRPRNPHTTSTKSTINIASAKLGVVRILHFLFLGSENSHTMHHPPKTHHGAWLAVSSRKWPRSLFRPVQPQSWKERSGAGWDQDGPGWPPPRDLGGSEILENKAHDESGRDPFGPGMGPGRAQDRTQARVWMGPPESQRQ